MSKVVKVYVVDSDGNGLVGQRVKTYGGTEQRTDRNGCVALVVEGSSVSIFVNGFTAFNGAVSRLDSQEVFTKSGGRP